jgi:hypothetical protein
MAATGGISAATTLMATAAGTDQRRTTFHASTMRAMQVPISQKYAVLGDRELIGVLSPRRQ